MRCLWCCDPCTLAGSVHFRDNECKAPGWQCTGYYQRYVITGIHVSCFMPWLHVNKALKLFQNCLSLLHVGKCSRAAIILWNNFEIILFHYVRSKCLAEPLVGNCGTSQRWEYVEWVTPVKKMLICAFNMSRRKDLCISLLCRSASSCTDVWPTH